MALRSQKESDVLTIVMMVVLGVLYAQDDPMRPAPSCECASPAKRLVVTLCDPEEDCSERWSWVDGHVPTS